MLPAMVLWQFFSKAFRSAGVSLSTNYDTVTKVFFPRLYLPLAMIIGGLVDLAFALAATALVMLLYQRGPSWRDRLRAVVRPGRGAGRVRVRRVVRRLRRPVPRPPPRAAVRAAALVLHHADRVLVDLHPVPIPVGVPPEPDGRRGRRASGGRCSPTCRVPRRAVSCSRLLVAVVVMVARHALLPARRRRASSTSCRLVGDVVITTEDLGKRYRSDASAAARIRDVVGGRLRPASATRAAATWCRSGPCATSTSR